MVRNFETRLFTLCKVDFLASKLFSKIGLWKIIEIRCKGRPIKARFSRKAIFHWQILFKKLNFFKNTRMNNIPCFRFTFFNFKFVHELVTLFTARYNRHQWNLICLA